MYTASLGIFVAILALCSGAPKNDKSWRIVGGTEADPGEAPYQIYINYYGELMCSGFIINERTIGTAAHCVVGMPVSSLTIVVGTNYLNSGGTVYTVKETAYHADFNGWEIFNDVAVIILDSPLEFSALVQPIPLSRTETPGDVDVKLTGWGQTNNPGDISPSLQKINLKTHDVKACGDMWIQLGITVYETQICTLTVRGEGACYGDSGGPLVSNGAVVGIVSWGSPCAQGMPDVFSRVSSFANWFDEHTQT